MKKAKYKPISKNFDIGIAFLRVILCFLVIIHHCYRYESKTSKWTIIIKKFDNFSFQVRTFFLMSFYYLYKTLLSFNFKRIYERYRRLLIPYIIWPVIFWLLNNLLIRKNPNLRLNYSAWFLRQQLLYGDYLIQSYWYLWDTFIITGLFIIIAFIFRRHYLFIYLILGITSFILQYNGMNSSFFEKYRLELKRYSFGRILEMIPCAVAGVAIADTGFINLLKKCKIKTVIICIYIIFFSVNSGAFNSASGFDFSGIKLYLVSICLFLGFAIFPYKISKNRKKNQKILNIIKHITGYTAGIYYLHESLFNIFKNYFDENKIRTILGNVFIYLFCYLICFIGNKSFKNTVLVNLFK